jgi:uncharacterized membrane protein
MGGAGLLGAMIAAMVNTLTEEGLRQVSAWESFSDYLRNITRGKEAAISTDLFDRYLPYAAGLGLATAWGKYFEKVKNVPVPGWFRGLEAGLLDGRYATIFAAVSSADSSASAAAGTAASGASGGGASGAG